MVAQRFLTVKEVVGRTRVTERAVRNWLRLRLLRGVKFPGGDWRISEDDLQELLEPAGQVQE